MPLTRIQSDALAGAITSSNIADGTIATVDLANNSVTTAKIAVGAVIAEDLASGAIENYMRTSGANFMFRNKIMNGDMRIDQRNVGNNYASPPNQGYTLDRWTSWLSQDTYSVRQNAGSVTPPPGFTNYLGVTVKSATTIGASDYFAIGQKIEGYNTADLAWGTANAKPITLSFWVRSSLTGNFGAIIRRGDGGQYYAFTYPVTSANTWEYKTITVPGATAGTWDTTNGTSIFLLFGLGAGTNQRATTNDTWVLSGVLGAAGAVPVVATNGATFYVTGVQIEAGSVATPFEYRSFGTELSLCQRYFEKTTNYETVPANGTSLTEMFDPNTCALLFAGHRGATPNNAYPNSGYRFKVTKRANPTITVFGNSSGYPAYKLFSAPGSFLWLNASSVWNITGRTDTVFVGNEYNSEGIAWMYAHFTASAEL